MAKKIQKKDEVKNLQNYIVSDKFALLDDEMKKQALNTLLYKSIKEKGFMEQIFGNNSKSTALYIAFIISFLLIIVGLIYFFIPIEYKAATNLEFWQIISPIISGALGYIFGSKN